MKRNSEDIFAGLSQELLQELQDLVTAMLEKYMSKRSIEEQEKDKLKAFKAIDSIRRKEIMNAFKEVDKDKNKLLD